MLESAKFEESVRDFCIKEFNVSFKAEKIKINDVSKSFDLVSDDSKHIGDVKYYRMCPNNGVPHAKLSTISEYVWLLEKTEAQHKFLIFGSDIKVPMYWLNRYKSITDVQFYFFDNNKLQILN